MDQLSCVGVGPWLVQAEHQPRPAEASGPSRGWTLALENFHPRYSHYAGPLVGSLTALASALSVPMMQKESSALLQSTDCAGFCYPTKSWSSGESTSRAQTGNFTGLKLGEVTDFHPSTVTARVAGGLKQEEPGAGAVAAKSLGQSGKVESSRVRGQFPQNDDYLCYPVLQVHCFILANKAANELKGLWQGIKTI